MVGCDRNPQGHFTPRGIHDGSVLACKRRAAGGPAWRGAAGPPTPARGPPEVQVSLHPARWPVPSLPSSLTGSSFFCTSCFLSSLLPGEEHGPHHSQVCVSLSLKIGVLGPASLSPWARRLLSPVLVGGWCPPSLLCGGGPEAAPMVRGSSTEGSSLSQRRKPAGGKV